MPILPLLGFAALFIYSWLKPTKKYYAVDSESDWNRAMREETPEKRQARKEARAKREKLLKRYAALQRRAEHPNTPRPEAENAFRHMRAMEDKYFRRTNGKRRNGKRRSKRQGRRRLGRGRY